MEEDEFVRLAVVAFVHTIVPLFTALLNLDEKEDVGWEDKKRKRCANPRASLARNIKQKTNDNNVNLFEQNNF